MNILNAELFPVEDRIYRIIPLRDSLKDTEEELEVKPNRIPYEEEDDDENDCDADLPIKHKGDRFHIGFHIPQPLIGVVIGHQGKTRQLLERDGASIDIINRRSQREGGLITIYGDTRTIVATAYHRVMDKIYIGRQRMDSTHFISLPVNSAEIQESFLKFKKEILEKYKKARGIDESIFQKPSKLHITVVPLILIDEIDNQNAIAILTRCIDDILNDIGEGEFKVQVKGIEYMNDDPAEVDVLYAKIEESGGDNRLQLLADRILREFEKEKLAKGHHGRSHVKLHITLMNTLFRSRLENDEGEKNERETFDARKIFEEYGDYYFGEIDINEIHISIRYTEALDGYYKSVTKIKLKTGE